MKWALETALPEIERLLDKDDYTAAFKLVEQARPFVADNPRFQALSARVVRVISVETTPPGAQVFIRDYSDLSPEWEPIGKSPLNEMKVPAGFPAMENHDARIRSCGGRCGHHSIQNR